MIVRLHIFADQELAAAAAFYEARAHGLGADFLAEAEATRDLLAAFPAIGPVLDHDIRRIAFRRFPYSYLYRIATEEIRVLAVMHHSRRPGYWTGRK
jgi:toxin ParE1/3/4